MKKLLAVLCFALILGAGYFIVKAREIDIKPVAIYQALNLSKKVPLENAYDSQLKILFVGDIMTDRSIRKVIQSKQDVPTFVDTFLSGMAQSNQSYDYVVANLEGPITLNKSKTLRADGSYSKELTFTLPVETLEILKALNIKVVSLANNHTDNFGREGFESTKKFLGEAGVEYFGNPYNSSDEGDSLSHTVCQKDICIAYIGYHQFTKDNQADIVTAEIKKTKARYKN